MNLFFNNSFLKKCFCCFISCFLIMLTLPVQNTLYGKDNTNINTAISMQQSFADIAEKYKPLVVSITTKKIIKQEVPQYEFFFGDPFEFFYDDFFDQPKKRPQTRKKYFERRLEGGGSGVIISEDGYVLTNYHVISDADDITVRVSVSENEDKDYDAKLVGQDPLTDLAVLKIKSSKKFDFAPLGDSDKLKVGDWVIAIGSPFGLEHTVTAGIVSARRQTLAIEGKRYENLIQTDAAINRGNSGGPLVSIHGEVIGINTAIYAPTGVFSGIGFAIPINRAKEILDDLVEKGKVVRGWLGVEIRQVDETIAKQFGLKETKGVLVNRVVEDSSAEKAGLQRGDIIIESDGKKIEDAAQLQKIVRTTEPGKYIKLGIIRNGTKKIISVKLGEMPGERDSLTKEPEKKDDKQTTEWKGIEVSNLTPDIAQKLGISKNEKGVVVININYSKQKANLGLREGDLIKEINRMETNNVSDFKNVTKKINLSEGIVFDIIRNGNPIYVTYKAE